MKKILIAITLFTAFTTMAYADFARVEVGAGAWMQQPNTHMKYKESTGFSGEDKSTASEETQGYVWVLVKHPIPLIPNLRVEYTEISSVGQAEGEFKFFDGPSLGAGSKSTLEMTQFDIIPYYNILDNTSWITVDLGLDIKIIETEYVASPIGVSVADYKDTSSDVFPLLYVRSRFEIPVTNIGIEADVKYISDGTSTVSDIRIKVDYTLDFIPIIQPGVELGYRMQKMYIETDEDLLVDYDFAGVYVGVMARF